MIFHAQLEIWKAAYSDDDFTMNWRPETTPSTASSEDASDGKYQTFVSLIYTEIFEANIGLLFLNKKDI